MIGLFQRINFFKGLFMKEIDWQKEQEYHLEKQRFHNKYLHTPGVVFNCLEGLRVSVSDTGAILRIAPGYAIDGEGRDLYVPEAKEITVPTLLSFNPPTTIYISLGYTENLHDRRENAANPMYSGYSRVTEDTVIEITQEKPDNHTRIELGRVRLSENAERIYDKAPQTGTGKALIPLSIKGRPGEGKASPVLGKRGHHWEELANLPGTEEPAGLDVLDLSQVRKAGAAMSIQSKALGLSDLGEKLVDTRVEVIEESRKKEDTSILIEQYPKELTPPMYITSVQSLDGILVNWAVECVTNDVGSLDYTLHIRNESNRSTTVVCRVFRLRIR